MTRIHGDASCVRGKGITGELCCTEGAAVFTPLRLIDRAALMGQFQAEVNGILVQDTRRRTHECDTRYYGRLRLYGDTKGE